MRTNCGVDSDGPRYQRLGAKRGLSRAERLHLCFNSLHTARLPHLQMSSERQSGLHAFICT
jgi:hypothetical protein